MRAAIAGVILLLAGCASPKASSDDQGVPDDLGPSSKPVVSAAWETVRLECAGGAGALAALEFTDTGFCEGQSSQYTQHTYFLGRAFALRSANVSGQFDPYVPFPDGSGTYRWSVETSNDGRVWSVAVGLEVPFDGSGEPVSQDWSGPFNVAAARFVRVVSHPDNQGLPGVVMASALSIEALQLFADDPMPPMSCHDGVLEQDGAEKCRTFAFSHTYFLGHPRSGQVTVSVTPTNDSAVDVAEYQPFCMSDVPPLSLRASADGQSWETIGSSPLVLPQPTTLAGDMPAGTLLLRISSPYMSCVGQAWRLETSSLTALPP